MTLGQLIEEIEAEGYEMQGKRNVPPEWFPEEIIASPLALMRPGSEPVMIENYLKDSRELSGFSRIDGAASSITGGFVVRLLFLRRA